MPVRHVLVADGDLAGTERATQALAGLDVETVATPPAALERVVGSAFDLVLLDPVLGDDDDGALALLHRLRTVAPDTVVVIWSDRPTVEFTVRAMRSGALDVLDKHTDGSTIRTVVDRADPARRARPRGPPAARRSGTRPRPRRSDRRVGPHASAVADDRPRRRLRRDGFDRRRERNGKGAARAHDPSRRGRAPRGRSSRSTAVRSHRA